MPKPLGNYGKNARQVKHGNDTKVGATVPRAFCMAELLGRGKTEDCIKDEDVGN